MPVTINAGPEQNITIKTLKDLENKVLTVLNLGKEIVSHFDQPLSAVPDKFAASVQYGSGNQEWDVNAVVFNLSGGVTGQIGVVKSGKLYDFTDSFPTQVELGLSTQDNSDASTTPFAVDEGAIYVTVELDFSIAAGVSITTAATSFGLSGSASASTSDTFQVAFYKRCAPADIFSDAIGKAFQDLVLPFHAGTIQNLKVGDILRHTAGANLQLGLGASIGFGSFSVAQQFTKGIKNLANSPTLRAGFNPTVTAGADLAYSFSYAGTFEQTLWRESDTSARLHLYKSTQKTHGLELTAGITANANVSAKIAVQKQILNAPGNALSNPLLQKALSAAFDAASGEIGKLAGEINSKISKLLSPINQDLTVNLDVSISRTNQTFLLTDYTIDLTRDFAAAWSDMINGKFVDALADGKGAVQLAVGSGLEKLYNRTASISLNLFGEAVAQFSESSIANLSLIYAGNNLFHLITAEGKQQMSKLGLSATEVDFYFSVEMDLSGGGNSAAAKPKLNAILRADNNPAFGKRIGTVVGLLTRVPASQDLLNQIQKSLNTANSTQVLHVVIPEDAYKGLNFSPAGSGDDGADRKNYDHFAAASKTTMPDGTPAQFVFNNHEFPYDFWAAWDRAVTGETQANRRKAMGPFDAAQNFLDPKFGDNSALRHSIGVTLSAATEFMNLCEDLKLLCSDDNVDINTWDDFAKRLGKIADKDVNIDFIVPAVLAITQLCGSGVPALTVGPAPGLSADTSIGVTMTFA